MAVKLFSFLGTSPYESCNYFLENNNQIFKDVDRCYVQEALLNILISTGIQIDEVTIFLTDDARKENWEGNKKYDNRPGLKGTLGKYKDKIKINSVDIPTGKSEEELWTIFEKVLANIDQNDEIVFDITHSFRSIPMLAIIILNYAKFVKGCHLKGIYYGAVETLGRPRELSNIAIENRNAPIFNLTPFVNLLDWTIAIDRFINTGDSRPISKLTREDAKAIGIRGDIENKKLFDDLEKQLNNFTEVVSTCRGQQLSSTTINLKNSITDILKNKSNSYVKPLDPLLKILQKRFRSFNNNEYNNILETSKWCLEHNLIQQGLTILQEEIITYICDIFELDRLTYADNRKLITQAVEVKNKPYEKWHFSAKENKAIINKMISSEIFSDDFCELMKNISNLRNDINHSGWNDSPCKPKKFKTNLEEYILKAKKILNS